MIINEKEMYIFTFLKYFGYNTVNMREAEMTNKCTLQKFNLNCL